MIRAVLLLILTAFGLRAQVTLLPVRAMMSQGTCQVATSSLPMGAVGAAYSQTLASAGCASPVTWDLAAGAMCAGLALQSSGSLVGTPTTAQTCSFTARATDALSNVATMSLSIQVVRGGSQLSGNFSLTGRFTVR